MPAKRKVVAKPRLARWCTQRLHVSPMLLQLRLLNLTFQLLDPVLQLGHLKLVLGVPGPHLVQNGLEAAVG